MVRKGDVKHTEASLALSPPVPGSPQRRRGWLPSPSHPAIVWAWFVPQETCAGGLVPGLVAWEVVSLAFKRQDVVAGP